MGVRYMDMDTAHKPGDQHMVTWRPASCTRHTLTNIWKSASRMSGRSVEEIFELDVASSRPAAAANKRLAADMPLPATRT